MKYTPKRKITTALLSFALVLMSGCTSTLKPPTLAENGRFSTSSAVDPEKITINGPFIPEQHRRMAVVLNFTEDNTIRNFYFQSIANSHVFEQVYSEQSLENYLLEHPVEGVSDTGSLVSLQNLARRNGNFLIFRTYIEGGMGYQVKSWLEVIDAASGRILFRAEKQATNISGLDGPLFYPLFNSFIDWAEGRTVSAPPVAPSN